MITRRVRGKRANGGRRVVLVERDLDVLALVALYRYLSTEQVARDLFPSEDRCRRRLRQLYDAGYVNLHIMASNEPAIVTLTASGLNGLGQDRPDVAENVHLPGPLRLAGLPHHLAVVDARQYVRALARADGGVVVRCERGQRGLARDLGLDEARLVPDAVERLVFGRDIVTISVELDRGTEGSRVLGQKLVRYKPVLDSGKLELWIVLSGGEGRRRNVESLVRDAGLAEHTRVMDVEHVRARPVRKPGPRVAAGAGEEKDATSVSYSRLPAQPIPTSVQQVGGGDPDADGIPDGRAGR